MLDLYKLGKIRFPYPYPYPYPRLHTDTAAMPIGMAAVSVCKCMPHKECSILLCLQIWLQNLLAWYIAIWVADAGLGLDNIINYAFYAEWDET